MTFRYFLVLSYNGSHFHGWQIQPHDETVQEVVERAMGWYLHQPTAVTGAGRTDAGVHATYFVAHFDALREDLDRDTLAVPTLNRMLPKEIVIHRIARVASDAHARFDALSRTYRYYISCTKNPFVPETWYHDYKPLDVHKIQEACQLLYQYTDFTSFSKLHTDVKTNDCRILNARFLTGQMNGIHVSDAQKIPDGKDPALLKEAEPRYDLLIFEITADRFLRNMVRAIMGTLIDVGKGKCSLTQFQQIIEAKDRCQAGTSMPAGSLYLTNIAYPYPY